jgi:hypothetical protein
MQIINLNKESTMMHVNVCMVHFWGFALSGSNLFPGGPKAVWRPYFRAGTKIDTIDRTYDWSQIS